VREGKKEDFFTLLPDAQAVRARSPTLQIRLSEFLKSELNLRKGGTTNSSVKHE
jgi:hypothetical protein